MDIKENENINQREDENKKQQESYAVKPHHHLKPMEASDTSTLKVRNILNLAFMILALAGAAIYMFTAHNNTGVIIMIVAVVIKVVEVSLRLFHK